ncbi:MFS transporter [Pedobacter metabolipauper]|uniref:Fucose permease n=1 Tax=Pedobacter metabolipauper TaxID=425513 RepID=A0A4R6SQV1_9SPHI|nr:MFS transporter [Pedobacter metabolipauper]TDQ06618.1 fucose permease [Pedobacter metabolipauper]
MNDLNRVKKASFGIKAIFLVCGLAISSWAPMVPFAKDRLGLNDANLGLLLLCLGAGAICLMPLSGLFGQKYGSRKVIIYASFLMAVMLPLLLIIQSVVWMGVAIFIFGAAVGTVDVAMNAHGVQVQNMYGKSVMSSFHGLFSVGGLLGSLGLGGLMKAGLEPIIAALSISILLIIIVIFQSRSLLDRDLEMEAIQKFSSNSDSSSKHASSSWLNASVLFLGAMCFIVFLSEGAMLDWSAVFLKENRGIDNELSGIGYAAFSIAMATMRLLGDKLVSRFSGKKVVIGGSILAAIGVILVIISPFLIGALAGFILLGLGAANIVPVFIGEGGRLKSVSALVAIPAITTIGYAGQLAGPALLGFIAHHFSLSTAFGVIAFLLLTVAAAYIFRNNEKSQQHG